MNKVFEGKRGYSVIAETIGMWHHVTLRNASGDLVDKIRCDTKREAADYWKSFKAIAKAN